mgnify:FL=1
MLLNLFKRFNANSIYNFMPRLLLFALFFLNSSLQSILYSQLGKQCICTHKMQFCLLGVSPKPSESIRNLIELPVCFHPFITYIIFASNQAFLPFHKPIPKTDKYLNENNPNSLVLKL